MSLILKNCKEHPSCPHGPCLMFERNSAKGAKTGRRFFACSACRKRSFCNFFHWVDDDISEKKKTHWEQIIEEQKPPFSHDEYQNRLESFLQLPLHQRKYCKTCSLLVLPNENKHLKHDLVENIDANLLTRPTTLFQTLEEKKAQAQYFFSDETVHFLVSQLKKLHYSKLVLIGVPKILEYLISNPKENKGMQSLFLDIDHRHMQFFNSDQFCHYNLFNHYFFDGKPVKDRFKHFLSEENGEKVAIVLDPPFGGLAEAISHTLKKMNKCWRSTNEKSCSEEVPVFWFFPYFLEKKIVQSMPNITMLDYKVEYANHKKFGSKAGFKGSPVRIFSNVEQSRFVLPKSEGYKFCNKCQRYVSQENQHCMKCNACTTKHGNTYKHCDSCQECVKSSYIHCEIHNKCSPLIAHAPKHSSKKPKIECNCTPFGTDEVNFEKCYNCFGYGHKKHDCPTLSRNTQKKMKV